MTTKLTLEECIEIFKPVEGGENKNMGLKPQIASPYALVPEGNYLVTIESVTEEANQWYDPEKDQPNKKNRWQWHFTMPDGVSNITYFTGTMLGTSKANLTKLVAAALGKKVGELTDKDKNDFDTDDIIGKEVMIKVIHTEENEDGNVYHKILTITPKKEKKEKTPF